MKKIKEPRFPERFKNNTYQEVVWSDATPEEFQAFYHYWTKSIRLGNWPKCNCAYCRNKLEEK